MKLLLSGSFRRRLFVAFLTVSLVPLLLSSGMLLQIFRMRLADSARGQGEMHLSSVSHTLDWLYEGLAGAAERLEGDPLVARALLRAWQAKDQRIWEGQGAYAPLVLPELGAAVDQAAAYEALLPTLLLTDGDRMIRVSLQSFDQTLPFDRWAPAAAAAFSAGGGA